jgi:hypothetical protein
VRRLENLGVNFTKASVCQLGRKSCVALPEQHLAVPFIPAVAACFVCACSFRVGGEQTQTRRPGMLLLPSCSGGRRRRRCGGTAPSGRRWRTPQVPACLRLLRRWLGRCTAGAAAACD